MVKINGNEVRPGHVLEHKGQLWLVAKCNAVKPGKGGAFNQVEMKNLRSGARLNERFRASATVERAQLEQRPCRYLYDSGDSYAFMDQESFEQIDLRRNFVGDKAVWLCDEMEVTIEFHQGDPLHLILPDAVTLEVAETEPAVKGQTAASSFKPARCVNGVRVMVPVFIGEGDRIHVATGDGAYLKRAE